MCLPSGFNPRPPLLAGDAWGRAAARRCWMSFQSAPAIAGGRCVGTRAPRAGRKGFNPRPPLLAGDAFGHAGREHATDVSIRARHCWRAMPPTARLSWQSIWFQSAPAIAGGRCPTDAGLAMIQRGFNPRPPLLAGDAVARSAASSVGAVSIRARHGWRAMPHHAPPSMRAGWFQSAPAIAGGRCVRLLISSPVRSCFNPRPPLLAGDAPERPGVSDAGMVSIRARHCWRAMLPDWRRGRDRLPVSIRARHCWRAMLVARGGAHAVVEFQSAPAIAGGRCRAARGSPAHHAVSIRARHCWRAMPWPPSIWRSRDAFQSAPAIAGGRCTSLPRHCQLVTFPLSSANSRRPIKGTDKDRM